MTHADKINNAIETGYTIVVSTYTRHTKIKKTYKAVKHWKERGYDFFKMSDCGEFLMMVEGSLDFDTPRYVNASGAKINAYK